MTGEIKILAVDDEPLNRIVMEELLGNEFELRTAEDSLACIEILDEWLPDLILMDVKMPGIDGLETCRQIKANSKTEYIPVIFVSALNLPEERIAGYEAGGDDYIVKPYVEKELLSKIKLSIENSKKIEESENNFQESMKTAMTAMTNTAEIGSILQFYQNSFSVDSYQGLMENLLEVISGYGLKAVISMITPDGTINNSNTGVVRPLEISVIEQLRDRETIFNFGNRSSYSYSNLTILILDMPVDDEDKYGRLKDHLAMLAEGGNARVLSLITEHDKKVQQNKLQDLVAATSKALQVFDQQQSENQNQLASIMGSLSEQVEESFFQLGLSEIQEDSLREVIRKSEDQANALFDKNQVLKTELESIMRALKAS